MTRQLFTLRVDADHPSLPGHFPGRPIVPAVVLLDRAIAVAEEWLARPVRVTSLQQAKFTRPLLPEQTACLTLTLTGGELRFEIQRDDERIAQGVFKVGLG
jgi:3-hydroxymyristoyl/3-hydroxydecanoyl-(acyl carrier protein) dehydratase